MLELPLKNRRSFWDSSDWNWAEVISDLAQEAMRGQGLEQVAADVADLALLSEWVVSDSDWTIQLYLWSWQKVQQPAWMARAIELSEELDDFGRTAELLDMHYKSVWATPLLEKMGLSYWDAGQFDKAVEVFRTVVETDPSRADLDMLVQAYLGSPEYRAQLTSHVEQVSETLSGAEKAQQLLTAARLDSLSEGARYFELLERASLVAPANTSVFLLLQRAWTERVESKRLEGLYNARAETAADLAAEIEVYRKAGQHLLRRKICSPELVDLGVRLLSQSLLLLYQHNLEVPGLIGILSLLVERLRERGQGPAGVRLLAKALAHPRSDDEVIWIVNTGIALAQDDVALARTTQTFEQLRSRVLERNSKIPQVKPQEEFSDDGMQFDDISEEGDFQRLYTEEMECIDEDFEEMTMPWHTADFGGEF